MRRWAALVVAAAVLAGCGGGSGPHLSEAAYQQRGAAVCGHYDKAIRALGQPTKLTQIGPFITRAMPILSRTVTQLGAIHPPAARADDFGRFLAAARGTVARARSLRAAAAKADGPAVERLLKEAARATGARDRLAQRAGLPACALD